MKDFKSMASAQQIPLALGRRLEDLENELAYIDEYPDRWDSQEARLVRRVAVVQMLATLRTQISTGWWACPIEQAIELDTTSGKLEGQAA